MALTRAHRWLWAAIVREPRSWFFSALTQWCTGTGAGKKSQRCQPGTTASDLLRAGWWAPLPRRPHNDSDLSRDGFLPYFDRANMQSRWLEALWQEEHWVVCSLQRLNSSLAAISSVIASERVASPPGQALQLRHSNTRSEWAPRRSALERSIQWDELRRYALLDEALYEKVSAAGCLAHTRNAWLRARLEPVLAPALWI